MMISGNETDLPDVTSSEPSNRPKKRKKSIPGSHLADTINRALKRTYSKTNREKVDK